MSSNKRQRYSFRLSTFRYEWLNILAKKLGINTNHLIGKIIRKKIRTEKEKLEKNQKS